MSYSVRNGKLIREEKLKWKWEAAEHVEDPEWKAWFETVNAKMVEMFGPPEDEQWGYTYEQDRAAEAALMQEGKHPPAHPCPL